MPAPLPPETAQGAQAPQGMPQPQGGGQMGSPQEAAQMAFRGLSMLEQFAASQGAPEAEAISQLKQQFEALIDHLVGGGAPQQPQGPMQGASPEAGAARVRPVG